MLLEPAVLEAAPTPQPAGRPRLGVAVALVAVVGLFGLLFAPTFVVLVGLWLKDPNYSHGFAVPLVSGWLAWRQCRRAGRPAGGDALLGGMGVLAGCLVHLGATVAAWPPLDFLALALVLRGVAVAAGGREWARHFAFPILFLFFMFPLPVTWTGTAALWLQEWVARISGGVLDLFFVCGRRGTAIHIAGVPEALVVAAECSGLRQIVAFVALGALLGHLSGRPTAHTLALVVLAVPVAIAANVLRVLLMGFGAALFGAGWIRGSLHDAPALFSVPAGLALFLLVNAALGRLWPSPSESGASEEPAPLPPRGDTGAGKAFAVVAVCLAAGVAGQLLLDAHLRAASAGSFPEVRASLAELPPELSASGVPLVWHGEDNPGLDALRARLPYAAADLISRTYRAGPGGPVLNLYAVFSRLGEDRKHHPEICIREVTGAPEDLGARQVVYLDAEERRPVQRFRFRTGTARFTTVYYWHYTIDPVFDGRQTFLQALHRKIGRPAPSLTVQVATLAGPEEFAAIEKSFLTALDRQFQANYLPATARMGCNRLPIGLSRE